MTMSRKIFFISVQCCLHNRVQLLKFSEIPKMLIKIVSALRRSFRNLEFILFGARKFEASLYGKNFLKQGN